MKKTALKQLCSDVKYINRCQFKGLDNVICNDVLVCSHIVPRHFKLLAACGYNVLCCCSNHEKYYLTRQDSWAKMIKKYFRDRLIKMQKYVPLMGKRLRNRFTL